MNDYTYYELDDYVGRSFYRVNADGKAWIYSPEDDGWHTDSQMTLAELQVFAAMPGVKVWREVLEGDVR